MNFLNINNGFFKNSEIDNYDDDDESEGSSPNYFNDAEPSSYGNMYPNPSDQEHNGEEPIYGLQNQLQGFRRKPIKFWTGEDCLDYVFVTFKSVNLSLDADMIISCKDLTGSELLSYEHEDFVRRFGRFYGLQLHEYFNDYKIERAPEEPSQLPPKKNLRFRKPVTNTEINEISQRWSQVYLGEHRAYSPYYLGNQIPDSCIPTKFTVPGLQQSPNTELDLLKKIQCGKRNRGRNPKSWEFLLRLLKCELYNPAIIRWEDEATGTFRLIKKDEIAALWAKREQKQPKAGSYDSFARILRYHYKTNALVPVSEKHLVYRFSKEVMDRYRNNEYF